MYKLALIVLFLIVLGLLSFVIWRGKGDLERSTNEAVYKLMLGQAVTLDENTTLVLKSFSHKHNYINSPHRAESHLVFTVPDEVRDIRLGFENASDDGPRVYDTIWVGEYQLELKELHYDSHIVVAVRKISLPEAEWGQSARLSVGNFLRLPDNSDVKVKLASIGQSSLSPSGREGIVAEFEFYESETLPVYSEKIFLGSTVESPEPETVSYPGFTIKVNNFGVDFVNISIDKVI